jgi:hypothetical protein
MVIVGLWMGNARCVCFEAGEERCIVPKLRPCCVYGAFE